MNKKRYIILAILLMIGITIASIVFFKSNDEKDTAENTETESTTDEEEDYIYTPSVETIVFDQEAELLFFEDIVEVYLYSKVTEKEADEITELVDGKIIGELKGALNVLQVQVDGKTFTELDEHIDRLYESDLVKYVSLSYPSFVADLTDTNEQGYSYDNTWGDDEAINEERPSGENWWAEAINAYSAWDYLDENDVDFEEVPVAIIEKHKLSKAEADSIKDTKNHQINVKDLEHVERVTKIIAGNEKQIKIVVLQQVKKISLI